MADVELDSYYEVTPSTFHGIKNYHPSSTTKNSDAGQSFTCGGSYKIKSCKFYLRKTGNPNGLAYAILYALTGSHGSTAKPTGSALATSGSYEVSNLTTSYQLITFTFTGVEQYQMSSGNYGINLQGPASGGIDTSNFLNVGADNVSQSHAGNSFVYKSDGWVAALADVYFYVYGESVTKPSSGSVVPLVKNAGLLQHKNSWLKRFPKFTPRLVI